MRFTTASGAEFSCGDGTGRPVSVRVPTTEAERRILLNPELTLGEIYMDCNFRRRDGRIADVLAILLDLPEILPRWAKLQWWLRYLVRHAQQFNPRPRARDMWRATTISTGGSILSSRCRQAIQLRLLRNAGRNARRCPTRQEVTLPRSCRSSAATARRYRLRLGRPWTVSGRTGGANVTRVTLSTEQLQVSNAAPPRRICAIGEVFARGLS